MRRQENQIKYGIKVKLAEDHPAKTVYKHHPKNKSKKFHDNLQPIFNKTNHFFSQFRDLDVEKFDQNKCLPPWGLILLDVDTDLVKTVNKTDCPESAKHLALAKIYEHDKSLIIYTDASKSDGRVGVSYYIPTLNISCSSRLSDCLSIYTGELTAIREALKWVASSAHAVDQQVVVVSDSLGALQAIEAGQCANRPNILKEILILLNTVEIKPKFLWVPSHVVIPGNETAGREACRVTRNTIIEEECKLELEEYLQLAETYIDRCWQNLWDANSKDRFYHKIVPKVIEN